MRRLLLCLLLAVPAIAHAQPAQEARSAVAACLSAVIDNAPVEDIDGDDVTIRRGKDPVSCTVRVTAGEPVVIREAVLQAIKRRSEAFQPARTAWEPGGAASRETWCALPSRKAVNVFLVAAKPGGAPVLQATVFETPQRDPRCDRDMGPQKVAGAEPAPSAAQPSAAADPPKAERKRKGWLPRLPRF